MFAYMGTNENGMSHMIELYLAPSNLQSLTSARDLTFQKHQKLEPAER